MLNAFNILKISIFAVFFVFSLAAAALEPSVLADAEKNAESDDEIAFQLGLFYLDGDETTAASTTKAQFWLNKATEGYKEVKYQAAMSLGYLYISGEKGFSIDLTKAEEYLKVSISGYQSESPPEAYSLLAQLYYNQGKWAESLEFAEKGALVGNLDSALLAADIYLTGKGTHASMVNSARFLKIAAKQNHVTSNLLLGEMYFLGNDLRQDYEEARKYYLQAAISGDDSAQNMMGLIFLNGLGVDESKSTAFKWFEKAADNENMLATNNLALMLLNGEGALENKALAAEYFEKAAKTGDVVAMTNLALLYRDGTGVEQSQAKKKEWLERAIAAGADIDESTLGFSFSSYEVSSTPNYQPADSGNAQNSSNDTSHTSVRADAAALFNLALTYANGDGVDVDDAKALELFEQSALYGNAAAQMNVGMMYLNERGTERSYVDAYAWIKVARKNNFLEAQALLDEMTDKFPIDLLEQGIRRAKEIERKISAFNDQ